MEEKRYKMKYIIDKSWLDNDILNILGEDFVKINRNKAKLIIGNKKYNLNEHIKLNNFKKSVLKIDILLSQNICNISYMFNNVKSLLKFSMKTNTENKGINHDFPEIEENKKWIRI